MQNQTITERESISDYLTELWKTILGKEVGQKDNFFEAGGTSLAGLKMIMKVQSDLKVEVDAETFFEEPCIENLARIVIQPPVEDLAVEINAYFDRIRHRNRPLSLRSKTGQKLPFRCYAS